MQDFPDISYESWLNQLQKELKTSDLSEKHVKIDENLHTDPFFERSIKQETGSRATSSWTVADRFSPKEHDQADILEALNGGIAGLILDHAEKLNDGSMFDGVFFEYLKTYFHFSMQPTENQLDNLLKFIEDKGKQHFYISTDKLSSTQIDQLDKQKIPLLRYYNLDAHHVVEQLGNITNKIVDYLDSLKSNLERQKAAAKIVINRKLSTDIIREIAIKQALDIIWAQIIKGFSLDTTPLKVHSTCHTVADETLERQYIALASKGLTAVTASYDLVHIAPADTKNRSFHRRISRNIQHLLKMESLMENYRSAYLGSHQISKISKEIATAVWKKVGQV